MCTVEILRSEGGERPAFYGRYDDKPIIVRLDCSAHLKLRESRSGAGSPSDRSTMRRIAKSSGRIIDLERQPDSEPLEITVSALDLD